MGAARLTLGGLAVVGASGAFGCLNRPVEPVEPRTTTTIVERLTQSSVDKIDLVLAIDNSRSMADKQAVLAQAVPDLVKGLVNPPCVNPETGDKAPAQPGGPLEECAEGFEREFEPVLDIHIGIISSSIGGYGADVCPSNSPDLQSNNDKGHLLARTDPKSPAGNDLAADTYQGKLFLAWDPAQKLAGEAMVPDTDDGEADLDVDSGGDLNTTALIPTLQNMVKGAGQVGCGYEAQFESWYRFLVDPEPYDSLSIVGGQATPSGVDAALLQQRADFLRPDSLLAIIMLTDENDCSIREAGQFYFAAKQTNENGSKFHLPRAREICQTNPNDECCKSCGQSAGNCGVDPTCFVNGDPAQGPIPLTDLEDAYNLRCYDQKRRFGIDFLYGIDRYREALTNATITNRKGEPVTNPLFMDLNPNDTNTAIRDPGLVFLAGIVGVPWQDIARDPSDLTKGFKNSDELRAPVGNFASAWEIILGDPASYKPPADPFMIETVDKRSGSNPITGDTIQDPGSTTENAINGTEWTIDKRDDLQYSCIFDLPTGEERDCSMGNPAACDCEAGTTNPLCAIDPGTGQRTALQIKAKAYPGVRELNLLRDLSSQGIVGSVCPKQLDDITRADYGYRPAIGSIIDRLKLALGGQCLPRSLTPNSEGQVSCLIIEARNSQGACDCGATPGRVPVSEDHRKSQEAIAQDPLAAPSGWDCYCEVAQLTGDELAACQTDASDPVQAGGQDVNGWCYVDQVAGIGDPAVWTEELSGCPATEKRLIRFVGAGEAQPGATLFITCNSGL